MTDHERDAFDSRPTAEQMLARLKAEAGDARGRLRVYLGMAPGVGKTFRMLEEGHRRRRPGHGRGRRLRGGAWTAPHARAARGPGGRAPTPRRVPRHRRRGDGHRRRHRPPARRSRSSTSWPTRTCRAAREKRWQDVEAIRDAGIHVVSTLNVQHLESVADAVATITGRPGQRAPARRGAPARRRDRARRHEPACAAAAHEARQRLSAGARPRSRSTASSPRRT